MSKMFNSLILLISTKRRQLNFSLLNVCCIHFQWRFIISCCVLNFFFSIINKKKKKLTSATCHPYNIPTLPSMYMETCVDVTFCVLYFIKIWVRYNLLSLLGLCTLCNLYNIMFYIISFSNIKWLKLYNKLVTCINIYYTKFKN